MVVAYAVAAKVLVDGAELERDVDRHVEEVVVDEDVSLPAMFAITFQDTRRDILDQSGLRVGAAVEIAIAGQGGATDAPLIKGDVVTIECDYDELGSRVVVRGYAASHRLHPGRHTRTFLNATDSDIVRRVAKEAGLELGEIQETSETYAHVSQANVSDWEFLTGRARAVGFDLQVVDGKLRFAKPTASADAPADTGAAIAGDSRDPRLLVYGDNLLAFHGRISSAEQAAEVEVRGWDDARKEPVVGTAKAGTMAAGLDLADPPTLAHFVGDPTFVAVDLAIASQSGADKAAAVLAERLGSAFVRGDGTARGNTKLRAGSAVRVVGVGEDFSGTYVLSQTRHVIDGHGYRTHFAIGRHPGSASASNRGVAVGSPAGGGNRSVAFGGLVRGRVSANDDPEKLGRVKVHFKWLATDYESGWMLVAQVEAANNSGAFFIPEVGDEVLVGFIQGDVNTPVVLGSLYNGVDKPAEQFVKFDNGKVNYRGLISRDGHEILMFDGRGSDLSGISLRTGDLKLVIQLNQKDNLLTISGDSKVVLEAYKELEVTSHAGMKIEAKGNLEIKAGGTVEIHGTQIKLN